MKVYHGSYMAIYDIDLSKCEPQKESAQYFNLEDISEKMVEKLIIDHNILEKKASELFFSSETFGKLADISTKFYEKPWQEIYEMLKSALRKK